MNKKMNKQNIINFYNALCKDLKIEPVKINFKKVGKGGACIVHNKLGKIFSIDLDLNNCSDIEYALYHEISHQILILKNNNFSHNKTFKNLEARLNEKYMYSKFSKILWSK